MKKIINGKIYDTKTAVDLEFYSNLSNYRDDRYYEETLYRKKTGEFFLHGIGGPASKYAVIHPDRLRTGGTSIIPLTDVQAMLWVEEHSNTAMYISIFGEV